MLSLNDQQWRVKVRVAWLLQSISCIPLHCCAGKCCETAREDRWRSPGDSAEQRESAERTRVYREMSQGKSQRVHARLLVLLQSIRELHAIPYQSNLQLHRASPPSGPRKRYLCALCLNVPLTFPACPSVQERHPFKRLKSRDCIVCGCGESDPSLAELGDICEVPRSIRDAVQECLLLPFREARCHSVRHSLRHTRKTWVTVASR